MATMTMRRWHYWDQRLSLAPWQPQVWITINPSNLFWGGILDLQSFLESSSSHWTTLTSAEGTLTSPSLLENIAVRQMMKCRGYKGSHGLGRHNQGDVNCIEGRLRRWCAGLGTDYVNISIWIANKPISLPSTASCHPIWGWEVLGILLMPARSSNPKGSRRIVRPRGT